jgi:hypothetical protein
MAADRAEDPMEYASTSTDEQEVVIRLDIASKQAHICSCSVVRSRRLTKLYGPPEKVSRDREGKVTTAILDGPGEARRLPPAPEARLRQSAGFSPGAGSPKTGRPSPKNP